MKPQRLTNPEINAGLKSLRGWSYSPKPKALVCECKMKGFTAAVRAIQSIANLAEKADHHPDIHLTRYKHLKIVLTTHEAGGVTQRDFRLAKQIKRSLK